MAKVAEIMTRDVHSVRRSEPLSMAARVMWDTDCGAVPVLDEHGERVVGMITDRDICMASWSHDRAPSAIPVMEAMSQTLYFCSPDDEHSRAIELMRTRRVRRVPVVGPDYHLVGIVSLADFVRRETERPPPGAFTNQILWTLAAISQGSKVTPQQSFQF